MAVNRLLKKNFTNIIQTSYIVQNILVSKVYKKSSEILFQNHLRQV